MEKENLPMAIAWDHIVKGRLVSDTSIPENITPLQRARELSMDKDSYIIYFKLSLKKNGRNSIYLYNEKDISIKEIINKSLERVGIVSYTKYTSFKNVFDEKRMFIVILSLPTVEYDEDERIEEIKIFKDDFTEVPW